MKKSIITIFTAAVLLTSCDIKKEESGALPDVDIDISADAGNLPEYDVDWADVDVKMETRTVEVPKLVVVMEEEEIQVPVIDVDMPGDKSERTLLVEAEVSDKEHKIEIQEIRATANKLYVISTLEATDRDLDGQTLRIQDQVDLNAPDLDVEYVIVGERPDRTFNKNNRYLKSMDDLNDKMKNAKVIYKR